VLTWKGVSRKTVWLWLPFTNAENQILKFSNFWNYWKYREISSAGQLKIITDSGLLKTGLSQDAWKVRGLKPLSKQYGSGFAEIRSGNGRSCAESWTYRRTRAERENIHFTDEKVFTIEEHYDKQQQDLCSNVPWGEFWGCRDAITLPTSWFGGRCNIRGWHVFIFARKGWNWCPNVSRGRSTRSCETA